MAPAERRPGGLDLDALERENDPGPFIFTLGGREYALIDPQDEDVRDLMPIFAAAANDDLTGAINPLLSPDDVGAFWDNRIPAFKLNALLDGWLKHYGLDPKKASASSHSSNGTARRSKPTSRSAA